MSDVVASQTALATGEVDVLPGGGKTTLLSVIAGFLTPARGTVMIGGRNMDGVPPKSRPTTTVFQNYVLFPHMSLLQNVAFGPRMRGQKTRERNELAIRMLELFGLRGGRITGRTSFPAGSASVWLSQGRLRSSLMSCCSTNRSAPLI